MNDLNDFSTGFSSDFSMSMDMGMGASAHPDKCTQCSICIQSCPTYQLTQDFNQSPMGRIKILRSQAEQLSDEEYAALESCLHCFQCEKVCPSKVDYRELIVDGYQTFKLPRKADYRVVALKKYVTALPKSLWRKLFISPLSLAATFFQPMFMPIQQELIRRIRKNKAVNYRSPKDSQHVLFSGCLDSLVQGETVNDTLSVLDGMGIKVQLESDGCCGALHRHSGDKDIADTFARQNISRHEQDDRKIISISSACGDSMKHYGQWLGDDASQAHSAKVTDIVDLLYCENWQPKGQTESPFRRVLIHVPCSANPDSTLRLLEMLGRIDSIEYELISSSFACCGAGGTHAISHPDLATKALSPILDQIGQYKADLVLSSNLGCTLHIASGLNGKSVPVMHPVSFFKLFS